MQLKYLCIFLVGHSSILAQWLILFFLRSYYKLLSSLQLRRTCSIYSWQYLFQCIWLKIWQNWTMYKNNYAGTLIASNIFYRFIETNLSKPHTSMVHCTTTCIFLNLPEKELEIMLKNGWWATGSKIERLDIR